ncbi:hypothetical protein DCAR_0209459 [Daucus carota subsp. sativus]|uniref:TRF2/HOY1 PH-like domain-containing protein n=1 Tax=Daucus carota subsp. sativus TaxID=79200 RepID=A0AAF0WIZ5_DAUCS|nr:PREDICTED: uncharacterized protein LOC108208680 [Daucus carota subsp. sativus]WOG90216.1 hypothetical protein DCAR_0209459 [Daucus carota subsp. sativus]
MFYFPNTSRVNYQVQPMALRGGEDGEVDEGSHFTKRLKTSSQLHCDQNWSSRNIQQFPISPAQYNPLDEPSPLGLKLRKSPSLLDLIEMKLSKTITSAPGETFEVEKKKDVKGSANCGSIDKLKASNFLASSLQIGGWKYASRHEGDLVAKCYYSKHKLVWEILEGGLKHKIEFQWSDIIDLKANYPDDQLGILNIVLSRPPIFFKESDPQPRKHTVWQATTDFTHGHASIYRQHFLRCPQGVLKKHYERLIQCDMRLKCLSQQPDIVLETPCFVLQTSSSERNISRNQVATQVEVADVFPISSVQSVALPLSASSKVEQMSILGMSLPDRSKEVSSLNSGAVEANGLCHGHNLLDLKDQGQSKVMGLHRPMSVNDLVNHTGHTISEQKTYGENFECKDMLGNIYRLLFSDTHTMDASNENSIMTRINSFGCLLQDHVVDSPDEPDQRTSMNEHTQFEQKDMCDSTPVTMSEIDAMGHEKDITLGTSHEQQPDMPRSDSFEDLMLHLRRIGSLPNILSDSENSNYHT